MLQIYAHQNPHIGYRQGMHEISSYLLLVIEMDLFDQESQQRESSPLLHPDFLANDSYCMFEAIMNQLGPAYDVKMNQGAESPMEYMAQSILAKIRNTACDKSLHQHLLSLNCPPELYCTRWVRLMFSREVAGWKNVLLLWDIFMDLISTCPLTSMLKTRYTRPGVTPALKLGGFSLMVVLEATSASMILLQRSALLNSQDASDSDSIHRLMNVPPLKNILPLTATLLSMMRRIQLHQDRKESPNVQKKSFTLSEMAQNAISTGVGQSFRNIWNAGGGPMTNPSDEEVPRFTSVPTLEGKRELHQFGVNSRTSAKTLEGVDALTLASKLNESLFTVKNFLMALENTSMGGASNHVIPQSVWDALEEVEVVQRELLEHQHSSTETNVTGRIV
jgi:hypothetical protein